MGIGDKTIDAEVNSLVMKEVNKTSWHCRAERSEANPKGRLGDAFSLSPMPSSCRDGAVGLSPVRGEKIIWLFRNDWCRFRE
jgi:hypothetical protein